MALDFVPFDWDSCPLQWNDAVIGQQWTLVDVGRRELHEAGRDEVRRDDHRVDIRRDRYVVPHRELDVDLVAIGSHGLYGPDLDTGDAHLVAGIESGDVGEVGSHCSWSKSTLVDHSCDAPGQ